MKQKTGGLAPVDKPREMAWLDNCYRQMVLIRTVETTLLDMFSKGLLNGTVHTCIGQEACAVGVVAAIDNRRDILFSNHRGHGHYLAYCGDVKGLVAEIMGRDEGICGGVGGSQHIQYMNFYTNGIQGAGAPIVVGMALAEKRKQSGAISIIFLGDGTFGEGALYEAMNIASLWSVPTLFVVEHNRYAQSTPFQLQHAGDIARRSQPFDIPMVRADGMSVDAVHQAAASQIAEIRAGSGPRMLLLDTYRFAPHSKGDDFRSPDEIASQRERDPLGQCEQRIDPERVAIVKRQARDQVIGVLNELGIAWA